MVATETTSPAGGHSGDAPRGHRLLGNLPAFSRDSLGFVTEVARRYGDVVPLRFGPQPVLFLNDPAAIEAVLVHNHKRLHQSRGTHRMRTLLGDGVVTSEGDEWLFQRRLMMPAFHRASVARYADTMVGRTLSAVERWASTSTVEMVAEMRRLTLEIAVETLFGRGLTDEEVRMVGESMRTAGEHMQTRVSSMKIFVPDWLPTPGNRRTRAAIQRMDGLVQRIIDERRRSPEEHVDLLALMVEARDEGGQRLSDKQLQDAVRTLMIAGHDTTASVLTWALYLLARSPAADAAMAAEIESVLGHERRATIEDVPRLSYVNRVVTETLRLYPSGFLTARETLSDLDIDGRTVPKGTLVLMSQWVRHRDPSVFEEPEAFRPDRWSEDFEKSLRRGDYFPFGMGPRQCIGQSFARLELVLTLATLRQRHRFELVSGEEVRPVPVMTLQPDRAVPMRLLPAALD
jgi:cytochrome P450